MTSVLIGANAICFILLAAYASYMVDRLKKEKEMTKAYSDTIDVMERRADERTRQINALRSQLKSALIVISENGLD